MRRFFLSLMLVTACLPAKVPLAGAHCDVAHPCPAGAGLQCNPYTLTCTVDATCPYLPAAAPCASGADYYLAPNGSDSNPGTSPDLPRATLSGPYYPGDRIHLAGGNYTALLAAQQAGAPGCPILLLGAPSYGSILQRKLSLQDDWSVSGVVMAATQDSQAIDFVGTRGLTVSGVLFQNTGSTLANTDVQTIRTYTCDDCLIVQNDFVLGLAEAIESWGAGVIFRGNHVITGAALDQVHMRGPNPWVESNELSGGAVTYGIVFSDNAAKTGTARRNVLHDLTAPGVVGTAGVSVVEQNTFLRLAPGNSLASAGARVFADNLVSDVNAGTDLVLSADGGYNLFDGVAKPYANSASGTQVGATDRVAPSQLDSNFVPLAGSAAVDAADPGLPVPAGGGARADIGAFERGATRLPDGRYCLPP